MSIELTFCVVNTEQRELLARCLDAIAARARGACRSRPRCSCSTTPREDGSVGAGRAAHPAVDERDRAERAPHGEADQRLRAAAPRARAATALLLNEDSELLPGATRGAAASARRRARARARPSRGSCAPTDASSLRRGAFRPSATALAGALFLHRRSPSRARGEEVREVDWAQSAALLVRREAAAQVGYLDPEFFVYSDEVDFCRRLRDAGWSTLYVPRRDAPSTTSSSRRAACPSGGSSSSAATASATCASTTPGGRRSPSAG